MGKEQPDPDTADIPTAGIAELAQHSLGDLLRTVGRIFIENVMESEVQELAGARSERDKGRSVYRWVRKMASASSTGSGCLSPSPGRAAGTAGRKCCSAAMRCSGVRPSWMSLWDKIMHGLTMRSYKEVVQQFADAYGLEKSTTSEHFVDSKFTAVERRF